MRVALRHTGTGHLRFVDTGWSWSIFLSAGLFGLPLFFRGLAIWGVVMVVLWSLQLIVPLVAGPDGSTLGWLLTFATVGLCFYLGFNGNAMSARHLVALGYDFSNPDSAEARIAAESWGI